MLIIPHIWYMIIIGNLFSWSCLNANLFLYVFQPINSLQLAVEESKIGGNDILTIVYQWIP